MVYHSLQTFRHPNDNAAAGNQYLVQKCWCQNMHAASSWTTRRPLSHPVHLAIALVRCGIPAGSLTVCSPSPSPPSSSPPRSELARWSATDIRRRRRALRKFDRNGQYISLMPANWNYQEVIYAGALHRRHSGECCPTEEWLNQPYGRGSVNNHDAIRLAKCGRCIDAGYSWSTTGLCISTLTATNLRCDAAFGSSYRRGRGRRRWFPGACRRRGRFTQRTIEPLDNEAHLEARGASAGRTGGRASRAAKQC